MDVVSAVIDRLRAKWPDPSRAAYLAWLQSTGASCAVCGWIPDGGTHTETYYRGNFEDCSERTRTLEAGLDQISTVVGGDLRECQTCGGLFKRILSGPPAADSLFEVSIWFDRLSPADAIHLVQNSEWWIKQQSGNHE